jgi:hypothetical protein
MDMLPAGLLFDPLGDFRTVPEAAIRNGLAVGNEPEQVEAPGFGRAVRLARSIGERVRCEMGMEVGDSGHA